MQQKNLLVFFVLCALILFGWMQLQSRLNPQKDKKPHDDQQAKADAPKPEPKPPAEPHVPKPVDLDGPLIQLGYPRPDEASDETAKKSKLLLLLDPRGAGVRSVTLNEFDQANYYGKPDLVNGQRQPLELVQADSNRLTPSYLLYDFPNDKADRPLDTLGKEKWDVIEPNPIVPGQAVTRAVFTKTIRDVRITKTYELDPGDYHVKLEVKVELADGKSARKFRYQIAGAHGLRLEGPWYTPVHLIAHILSVDAANSEKPDRKTEELARLGLRGGGDEVLKAGGRLIRYAAVATQFFASAVVVDDNQEQGVQDFIARARPTLESAWIKVKFIHGDPNTRFFDIDMTPEATFFGGQPKKEKPQRMVLAPGVELPDGIKEGTELWIRYFHDAYDQMQAVEIPPLDQQNRLHFDDITVRMSTQELDLVPGKPVVHKYLLYHGPVKVRLLADQESPGAAPELVERYTDTLRLDTLTDYHSNNVFGRFADSIGWTWVLIKCTNLMHGVLWGIHHYLGLNYGLCIILLTLLVRSGMFPLSRKQTIASRQMQDKMAKLKPEIEKLKEKYKGDPQALKQAQTELMLKNGMMNPFSSCWIVFLQMPIFMGLYYCLQESIHFRLASFLWIENLAAPDMLIKWGESIWLISSPSNYGGSIWSILYLGPFFNLLPLFAVSFMIVQQNLTMPPPTDEQQATQRKMMKYMAIFMGLFFYKVAAGLCIYFIISSVWGFCERKLIPKKQAAASDAEAQRGRFSQWMLDRMAGLRDGSAAAGAAPAGNVPTATSGRDKRDKARKQQRKAVTENGTGMLHKLRALWEKVLKEASKK